MKLTTAEDDWSDFFVVTKVDLSKTQNVRVALIFEDNSMGYTEDSQLFNFTLLYEDKSRSDGVSFELSDLIEGREVTLKNSRTGTVKVRDFPSSNIHVFHSDRDHWTTKT